MNTRKLIQLAAFSASFCVASSFAASNDALLDLLVEKGILTETEATGVAEELKEEAPVYVKPKSKIVKDIKLTGRLDFVYDGLSNDIGESSQNGFYFRRVRIGADVKFFDDYYAKLMTDFGGDNGDSGIDKAVLGWKYDPKANFEAGYTRVPFGFYETTSSSKIKTVERSIADRYFAEGDGLQFAGRHSGLFAKGDLGSGFSYSAAVVSSDDSNDREDDKIDDENGLGVYGRLQWECESGLLVGVDLGLKQDGSNFAGGDGDLFGYGLHASYEIGDFNISGELLGATVQDESTTGGDVDTFGITLVPSYRINDKWEIAAGYSYIDTDDADLLDVDDLVRRSNVDSSRAGVGRYSEGESYYIGATYYIMGNDLKLVGGYEFATFENTTGDEVEVEGIRLRLQTLF